MPIYEYECQKCGYYVEKLQKISDPEIKICETCGKDTLVKKVSAAGFRLKGGGWYESDFKTGNKKNLAEVKTSNKKPASETTKPSETITK